MKLFRITMFSIRLLVVFHMLGVFIAGQYSMMVSTNGPELFPIIRTLKSVLLFKKCVLNYVLRVSVMYLSNKENETLGEGYNRFKFWNDRASIPFTLYIRAAISSNYNHAFYSSYPFPVSKNPQKPIVYPHHKPLKISYI